MKTQKYIFTDYGEIVYVPNREIKDKYFDNEGRFCTLTNIDSGYDFHWAKILFQSDSLTLCIDYAIKTVTDNPKLLKKFIDNLDGTTYTVEYKRKKWHQWFSGKRIAYIKPSLIECDGLIECKPMNNYYIYEFGKENKDE